MSVKANGGSAGIDQESLGQFEENLSRNLYKLWNRMCSGSYFPLAVKAVVIPKKSGGVRMLGVPTIGERFRQCGLELHLDKTRIVYCKDIDRRGDFQCVQFTFRGYAFRPRKAVDKYGRVYVNFAPAVSRDALKEI